MFRAGISTLALAAVVTVAGCSSTTDGTARATHSSAPAASATADKFYLNDGFTGAYWFATADRKWRCAIVPQIVLTRISDPVAGCEPGAPTNQGFDSAPLVPDHFDGTPAQPDSLVVGKNEDAGFYSLGQPYFWAVGKNGADVAPVLGVGESIVAAGFTCNATATGVSCKSDSTGKGFTISGRTGTLEYTPAGSRQVYTSAGPKVVPGSTCGLVRIPATGDQVRVHVDAGVISCRDAQAIVTRYEFDRFLVHTGDNRSAEFDGWTCRTLDTPNAIGECARGDIQIRMRRP